MENQVYKVCDCCSELFFENEEHSFFEGFGFVCFLCLDEGFEYSTKEEIISEESTEKSEIDLSNENMPPAKFPKINLNS